MISVRLRRFLRRALFSAASITVTFAADKASENTASSVTAPPSVSTAAEIEDLKKKLTAQQRQIEELRQMLTQFPLKSPAGAPRSLGEVASTSPSAPYNPAPVAAPVIARPEEEASPLQFKIGKSYLTPVGFMDFTMAARSTGTGSGIGSNFGNIPFANTATGNLSETRLSAQNSRAGLRLDTALGNVKVLGYLETDFLGFVPTNAAVTSNAVSNRLRLFWASLRKGNWEIQGGQSWSMLTPNRKGMGALPSDLFFTQDIDVNYQAGLVWSRDPGFRALYHAGERVTLGVSVENPEQYVGGSAGAGSPIFPSSLSALSGSQLNNGATTLSVPNVHPDMIAKMAFDPSSRFHVEVAGVERTFKIYNPNDLKTYSAEGRAMSVNLNYELFKGFRLITNNYWGTGGGRFIFGLAPDLILRANGEVSPIHSSSTVSGFEWTKSHTMYYAYYGGVYVGRNVAIDTNGKPVGYGFAGSPNSQNRTIQEASFGLNRTFWKDPRYGAFNFMLQYSYLQRNPWAVAAGTPVNANVNIVYMNLRYTLPGSAPALPK